MTPILSVMRALQKLVADRLAELDLSLRRAAERSGGLLVHTTLHRIVTGSPAAVEPRTIKGIALALQLPEKVVADAAAADAKVKRAPVYRLPDRATELSPKGWQTLLKTLDFLLEQQKDMKAR